MIKLNKTKINIDVIRVFDFSFKIREDLANPKKPKMRFTIEHQIGFNVQANLINFKIRTFYTYIDNPDEIVMDISVDNVFKIANLGKYVTPSEDGSVKETEMNIPGDVLIKMSDMALSHTRALLAKNKGNSVFDQINLPYIDSINVAKMFFGRKIDDYMGNLKSIAE